MSACDQRAGLLNRRRFLATGSALALVAGTRSTGAQDATTGVATPAPPGGEWSFTDDRGVTVSLPARPERIVAFSPVAAAMWDLGLRPVGVFGPYRREDGSPDPQIGAVDLDAVVHLGDYGDAGPEFDLEQLIVLDADLLVGLSLPDVPNTIWYVPEEVFGTVESIVPTVGLALTGRSALQQIEGIEDLGSALGADLDSSEHVAVRQEFAAAETELRAVIAGGPELTVLVISAGVDTVYVANPAWFGDLLYLQDLGLSLVTPETDERWQMLSWEQIGQFPADFILVDARGGDLPHEIRDGIGTWQALPAVQAGQVGPWRAVYSYGRRAFTGIMREVTGHLEQADGSVVT